MSTILSFIVALSVSTLALPVLIRNAATWRLLDMPDARKLHVGLVPRVGGIAIVLATLLSALIWSIPDASSIALLLGALVIALFGLLDDRNNLDYRIKFGGQIIGAVILVAAGIQLHDVPFIPDVLLPPAILAVLTVIFLLATTNAFNLVDGLDGLAAGCGGLTLAAIAALSLAVTADDEILLITAAALGGILGFLRYNTHPALVYMGDAGSQFIGFTIGALALLLLERSGGNLSASLIFPLLGLPVIDTIMVMAIRLKEGRSPFSPDRNHIHYQLLSIGLKHHQAVAAIYLMQAALVSSAILLRAQSDAMVLGVYGAIVSAGFIVYGIARALRDARAALPHAKTDPTGSRRQDLRLAQMRGYLLGYIGWCLVLYLIVGAFAADVVSLDISVLAFCCACLAAAQLIWPALTIPIVRLCTYVAAIYVSYLNSTSMASGSLNSIIFYIWLGSVALAILLMTLLAPRNRFALSTQDLLALLMVLGVVVLPIAGFDRSLIAVTAVCAMTFIYACEALLSLAPAKAGRIGLVATASLLTITALHFTGMP